MLITIYRTSVMVSSDDFYSRAIVIDSLSFTIIILQSVFKVVNILFAVIELAKVALHCVASFIFDAHHSMEVLAQRLWYFNLKVKLIAGHFLTDFIFVL